MKKYLLLNKNDNILITSQIMYNCLTISVLNIYTQET